MANEQSFHFVRMFEEIRPNLARKDDDIDEDKDKENVVWLGQVLVKSDLSAFSVCFPKEICVSRLGYHIGFASRVVYGPISILR